MDSLEPILQHDCVKHPDFRDVAGHERIHTRLSRSGFTHPGGSQANLFSSQDQQTVDRHFDWMQDYGIDGVWLSRFVVGVANHPTNVLMNVRNAANRTGRTFALEYDMSGQATNTLFTRLTNDWRWLVDNLPSPTIRAICITTANRC
jgi:hypothetical protein